VNDPKRASADKDDCDLSAEHDGVDAEEKVVCEDVFKDVEFVVKTAVTVKEDGRLVFELQIIDVDRRKRERGRG